MKPTEEVTTIWLASISFSSFQIQYDNSLFLLYECNVEKKVPGEPFFSLK